MSSAREMVLQHNYAQADRYLLAARSRVRESANRQDLDRLAVTDSFLGSLRHDQGSYEDAEMFYTQSIGAWEKANGDNHPGLVRLLNDLASLYLDSRQFSKAERTCARSLQIQTNTAGVVPPLDIAKSLSLLGGVNGGLGKYQEAESAYLKAEEIFLKEVGAKSPEMATVWNNLGVLYAHWKLPAKAAVYLQRSTASVGDNCSPGNALMLTNLAAISTGVPADAETAFLRASECASRAFGPEHPQTAEVLSRYALFLRQNKRKAEAARIEAQVHGIREKVARGDRARFTVDAKDLHAASRNAHQKRSE